VPNPVEIIGSAGARIARLAAIRVFLGAVGPALTAIILGLLLGPIGDLTWARWGYVLPPERADLLSMALLAVGAVAIVVGGVIAYRTYRGRLDFLGAAAELDDLLDSQEQIITFATLANPQGPEGMRARRTPLFPVLWRRAIACFEGFDARREFRLEVGEPLKRSSIFAGVVALAMILATLGLVRPPTAETREAAKLRAIAVRIARSATTAEDSSLVAKIREAANALENPKTPPQEKKKRIEEAMQQAEKAKEKRNNSQSGNGQGTGTSKAQTGKGTGNSKGTGEGKSESAGTGEGKSGTGQGKNEQGKGSGKNEGGKGGKGSAKNDNKDKNDKNKSDSNIDLQNELAKAEAQVETADAKNPGQDNGGGDDKNKSGSKPGEDQNQKGGNQPDPNLAGNIPKPGANGNRNIPAAGGNSKDNLDRGSNLGDTHLGEMPSPQKVQRYLKPGEKGDAIDIKDARYVMFRIPGATVSAGSGKTVLDNERHKARTEYVNAPLAPSSDNAPPDERQLVPPRYRDMIH
jgi:hypothetical protein